MKFAQYFDEHSGRWCRHVTGAYGDAWFLHASYDESCEKWVVTCSNEAGASLGEWEYSGRLTLGEALEAAQSRWTPEFSSRSVYSLSGQWVGLVIEVDLPRMCLDTGAGVIWLRVDAIFCHTPAALHLVCDREDIDTYRTEIDRPYAKGRPMVCGWCQATMRRGAGVPRYGICAVCEQREDLETFPYGDLVNRPRG